MHKTFAIHLIDFWGPHRGTRKYRSRIPMRFTIDANCMIITPTNTTSHTPHPHATCYMLCLSSIIIIYKVLVSLKIFRRPSKTHQRSSSAIVSRYDYLRNRLRITCITCHSRDVCCTEAATENFCELCSTKYCTYSHAAIDYTLCLGVRNVKSISNSHSTWHCRCMHSNLSHRP